MNAKITVEIQFTVEECRDMVETLIKLFPIISATITKKTDLSSEIPSTPCMESDAQPHMPVFSPPLGAVKSLVTETKGFSKQIEQLHKSLESFGCTSSSSLKTDDPVALCSGGGFSKHFEKDLNVYCTFCHGDTLCQDVVMRKLFCNQCGNYQGLTYENARHVAEVTNLVDLADLLSTFKCGMLRDSDLQTETLNPLLPSMDRNALHLLRKREILAIGNTLQNYLESLREDPTTTLPVTSYLKALTQCMESIEEKKHRVDSNVSRLIKATQDTLDKNVFSVPDGKITSGLCNKSVLELKPYRGGFGSTKNERFNSFFSAEAPAANLTEEICFNKKWEFVSNKKERKEESVSSARLHPTKAIVFCNDVAYYLNSGSTILLTEIWKPLALLTSTASSFYCSNMGFDAKGTKMFRVLECLLAKVCVVTNISAENISEYVDYLQITLLNSFSVAMSTEGDIIYDCTGHSIFVYTTIMDDSVTNRLVNSYPLDDELGHRVLPLPGDKLFQYGNEMYNTEAFLDGRTGKVLAENVGTSKRTAVSAILSKTEQHAVYVRYNTLEIELLCTETYTVLHRTQISPIENEKIDETVCLLDGKEWYIISSMNKNSNISFGIDVKTGEVIHSTSPIVNITDMTVLPDSTVLALTKPYHTCIPSFSLFVTCPVKAD